MGNDRYVGELFSHYVQVDEVVKCLDHFHLERARKGATSDSTISWSANPEDATPQTILERRNGAAEYSLPASKTYYPA